MRVAIDGGNRGHMGDDAHVISEAPKYGHARTNGVTKIDPATGDLCNDMDEKLAETRCVEDGKLVIEPVDENGDIVPGAGYVIHDPGSKAPPKPPEVEPTPAEIAAREAAAQQAEQDAFDARVADAVAAELAKRGL